MYLAAVLACTRAGRRCLWGLQCNLHVSCVGGGACRNQLSHVLFDATSVPVLGSMHTIRGVCSFGRRLIRLDTKASLCESDVSGALNDR